MSRGDIFHAEGVHKGYIGSDGPVQVFNDFALAIPEREYIAIVGSSGCGKSTLLRMLAGLERPDRGRLLFKGSDVDGPARGVGYLPQTYDLFPWKTVTENIQVALAQSRLKKEQRRALVTNLIGQIRLSGFENAFPKQLSGGMRQRAALARTLACSPAALLLDEPFGALDAQTRQILSQFVRRVFEDGTVSTVVLVTHDLEEAIRNANRVLVLSRLPTRIIFSSTTLRADRSAPPDDVLLGECRKHLYKV
jgi:ABC-type nitrate/sulfonate/bicarbonate transport system ATPase subunit